jgi:hypothetical protein
MNTCLKCGVAFRVKPSKAVKAKYCSMPCAALGATTGQEVRCIACGKPARKFQYQMKRDTRHFCSNDCKFLAQKREQHPGWKGGRNVSHGYIQVRNGKGRQFEHRVVAEAKIGRPLAPGEVVHHINGVKSDNRPENLEILSNEEHSRRHGDERKPSTWAICHVACRSCGTTERPHGGHGLCRSCYMRWFRDARRP